MTIEHNHDITRWQSRLRWTDDTARCRDVRMIGAETFIVSGEASDHENVRHQRVHF